MKIFTVKDFLFLTKYCKSCGSVMNLECYSVNSQHNIDSLKQITFNIEDDVLLLHIKHKYNAGNSEAISINTRLHTYVSQNVDNDLSIAFHRVCKSCKNYNVVTNPLFFNKLLSVVNVKFIDLAIKQGRKEYIITQNDIKPTCKVSISPAGLMWDMPMDILSWTKEDILKKIARYEILQ